MLAFYALVVGLYFETFSIVLLKLKNDLGQIWCNFVYSYGCIHVFSSQKQFVEKQYFQQSNLDGFVINMSKTSQEMPESFENIGHYK